MPPTSRPSDTLTLADVPPPGSPWRTIEAFALTFDGVAALGGPKALDELVSRHSAAGTLPGTLDELRAFLFFEQRRFRHYTSEPRGSERVRIDRLLEQLRSRVQGPAAP